MHLPRKELPLHENCMNYGGMSWKHTLELVDAIPDRNWFDTANPAFNRDRSKEGKPWQDSEFYRQVRDHIAYIHVKVAGPTAENKDKKSMFIQVKVTDMSEKSWKT